MSSESTQEVLFQDPIGLRLRLAREKAGLTVEQVGQQLKLPVAIVQAMVTLAHALKIEVTAEGVETHDQAKVLKDLGCNVYQGFLFAAPVPPSGLEALLRQPHSQVA